MNPLGIRKKGSLPPHPGFPPSRAIKRLTVPEAIEGSINDGEDLFEDDGQVVAPPSKLQGAIHEEGNKVLAKRKLESAGRIVRMSIDVDHALHRRMKFEALRQDRTMIRLIESWIEEHCPEV